MYMYVCACVCNRKKVTNTLYVLARNGISLYIWRRDLTCETGIFLSDRIGSGPPLSCQFP